MADPAVREYINTSISGIPQAWPMDWFAHWLRGRQFASALSVGCGTGALERDLVSREICLRVDAFDGSSQSIQIARELAAQAAVADRIHYFLSDFNDPELPRRRYDAVFFHQSAHHVGKLEKLYAAILRALKPDGLLYLDEYVGPSRNEWTDDLVRVQRTYYERLPPEMRLYDELPLPIHRDDPSEALRSSEIIPQLQHGFRIRERRDYGGSLLSVLFPALRPAAITADLVNEMITEEKIFIAGGLPPYYAIIVAVPKRGIAGAAAFARYYLSPKLRRLRWEIMSRISAEIPKY
jgi:SAM-dependent methyltransferase